jgi:hypothetical protein
MSPVKNKAAIFFVFLAFACIGCQGKSTYSRANAIEAIKAICKKEYNITNVAVKIQGRTLAVLLPAENIFSFAIPAAGATTNVQDMLKSITISKETAEALNKVVLAISRVALSSGEDLDFYTVIVQEKSLFGLEIVMTRYVPDLRHFLYGDISRGEFFEKRMHFEIRINPQFVAERLTKSLCAELFKSPFPLLQQKYFSKDVSVYSALGLNPSDNSVLHEARIAELHSLQISADKALVFLRVDFLYGATPLRQEYLFVVARDMKGFFGGKIERVYTLKRTNIAGETAAFPFPIFYRAHENVASWDHDFYIGEIRLPSFLAEQIARRIKLKFAADPALNETYKVTAVQGVFKDASGNRRFEFSYFIAARNTPMDGGDPAVKNLILDVIASIIIRYQFNDFDDIALVNTFSGETTVIPRDDLKHYRTWKIKTDY